MKLYLTFLSHKAIKRLSWFFVLLFFLSLSCFFPLSTKAEGENFKINHADNLEILEDRIILSGTVSVSSVGEDSFTLLTDKLVSLKDLSGQYGDIECFGISNIISNKFNLKADKLFFRKDKATQKYNILDAKGSVLIEATDRTQKVEAPIVKINLLTKKLFASSNVRSEQLIEDNNKKQKVIITSEEQEINLEQDSQTQASNKKKTISSTKEPVRLQKQLTARHNVTTTLESEVEITSRLTEIYTLNGKGEKAVFTDNAVLKANDGSTATGEIINYYLNQKLLELESGPTVTHAHLTKPDGTEIIGDKIKYNSETKDLNVVSKPQELSLLKVPYKEADGSIAQMIIKADTITNKETSSTESVLEAHQNTDDGLVELTYGLKRGWGRQLFITQDKAIPNKKGDYLLLIDEARILDPEKEQDLLAPVIKIGLGEKDLQSGFTGRAKGYLPLNQSSDSQAKVK